MECLACSIKDGREVPTTLQSMHASVSTSATMRARRQQLNDRCVTVHVCMQPPFCARNLSCAPVHSAAKHVRCMTQRDSIITNATAQQTAHCTQTCAKTLLGSAHPASTLPSSVSPHQGPTCLLDRAISQERCEGQPMNPQVGIMLQSVCQAREARIQLLQGGAWGMCGGVFLSMFLE